MPLDSSLRKVPSFRGLTVWQLAVELVVEIYSVSKVFPKDERYGLTAQVRRAAVSIPANIAEGNSRGGRAEYRQFVSIARGSLAEVETELLVAERLGYIRAAQFAEVRDHAASIGRMLTNLWKSLKDDR